MAGSKALELMAMLLVAAALLHAATATAAPADEEHMYHWKCFTSCNTRCPDDDSKVGAGAGQCKKGCLDGCFQEYPVVCYQQCVVSNCLCKPPYSKEKMECMKTCCDKCFHHGPAPPVPPKPSPPKPSPPKPSPPKPTPPVPSPPKPTPPKPSPPKPTPPKPSPPKPRPPCPPGPDGEKKMAGGRTNK